MNTTSQEKGFTLIEILISIAIFGLVMGVMYSLYISMNRTTVNQTDILEVQQNVRIALDRLSRDIRMAGALVPAGTTGIQAGSNATTLNIALASDFHSYARIASDIELPGATATPQTFSISVPASVDNFEKDDIVRIFRPQDGSQPVDNDLIIDSVNRAGPSITVKNFNNTDVVQYKEGDIIARVGATAPDPATIVWTYVGTNLNRNRGNVGADLIAEDISNLNFTYLLADGTETTTPANSELEDIRAVRVTLTADAVNQVDRDKHRSLSSTIFIRNYLMGVTSE